MEKVFRKKAFQERKIKDTSWEKAWHWRDTADMLAGVKDQVEKQKVRSERSTTEGLKHQARSLWSLEISEKGSEKTKAGEGGTETGHSFQISKEAVRT